MQFRIILALVASYLCFVQGQQQSCKTPSGDPGNCISLYDCSSLLAIVKKRDKSQEEINTLKQSHCGFQGKAPKVCCPTAASPASGFKAAPPASNFCFTPDAQEGKCASINSCSHLANLLAKPNEDIIAFVQSSKCEGPEQYSVCCGGKAPDFNPPKNRVCSSTVAPPDPRSGCCGRESATPDRIIGGHAAGIDEYPWMALIEYYGKENKLYLICGGSLISGKYVLTAGHCVLGDILNTGTPRNVRLGEYDTSNDPKEPDCITANGGGKDCTPGVEVIPIEKIKAHEEYIPGHYLRKHDIALLRLSRLAPFTEFIRPICLPQKDITLSKRPDLIFDVAGWGALNNTHRMSDGKYSPIKQYVDVPYINKDECQQIYSVAGRKVPLWNGQLCAGGKPNKDSCNADSGGPLMYTDSKTYEVVGVVSFGPRFCGTENIPGVYTKVFEYQAWIRKNILP